MEDLHWAGGIGAVMERLKDSIRDNPTVSGKRVKAIINEDRFIDGDVIVPLNKAYHAEGGIAVLKGNITPLGAVSSSPG
jgi:dihydroxy-acid dehydratase